MSTGSGFVEFLRSLSFGALFAGALAGVFQILFLPQIEFETAVFFGATIGGGLHRLVSVAWDYFVAPILMYGRQNLQLRKLHGYRERGLISDAKFVELAEKVIEQDLLEPTSTGRSHGG
jgi:hypothetical protein